MDGFSWPFGWFMGRLNGTWMGMAWFFVIGGFQWVVSMVYWRLKPIINQPKLLSYGILMGFNPPVIYPTMRTNKDYECLIRHQSSPSEVGEWNGWNPPAKWFYQWFSPDFLGFNGNKITNITSSVLPRHMDDLVLTRTELEFQFGFPKWSWSGQDPAFHQFSLAQMGI